MTESERDRGSSLCETCAHVREVVSGKGSRFLLCQRSQQDRRFPKYPPQPVMECEGFEETGEGDGSASGQTSHSGLD